MIKKYERIVLTEDLPNGDFKVGDVGVVVMIHAEGAAYEVEFLALNGRTIAVQTVDANQLRPVENNEIMHVRKTEAA